MNAVKDRDAVIYGEVIDFINDSSSVEVKVIERYKGEFNNDDTIIISSGGTLCEWVTFQGALFKNSQYFFGMNLWNNENEFVLPACSTSVLFYNQNDGKVHGHIRYTSSIINWFYDLINAFDKYKTDKMKLKKVRRKLNMKLKSNSPKA